MKKIYVHIDHLVLEGIDPQGQSDYVMGLQQGLQNQLANEVTLQAVRTLGNIKQLSLRSDALLNHKGARNQGNVTASHIVRHIQKNGAG